MSAIISDCLDYRYRLEREIDMLSDKTVAWIMVNPSTADATKDDQTIKKVKGFSAGHGFGRAIVGNLFAFRTKDVRKLADCHDPVGPENVKHLTKIIAEADKIIVAWGSIDKVPEKWRFQWASVHRLIIDAGRTPFCLGQCKNGHPRHPQMLGYDTPLTVWRRP